MSWTHFAKSALASAAGYSVVRTFERNAWGPPVPTDDVPLPQPKTIVAEEEDPIFPPTDLERPLTREEVNDRVRKMTQERNRQSAEFKARYGN